MGLKEISSWFRRPLGECGPVLYFGGKFCWMKWGFDIGPAFGWWLTYSKHTGLYFSPDATPSHPKAKIIFRVCRRTA